MSTFKLQVHSRDLAVPVVGGIASHTGYDLVEYDDNGKVLSIKSIDLVNKDGIIWFDIREKTPMPIEIDGKKQVWPNTIYFDDNPKQKVTQEFAENNHFYTANMSAACPQDVFNQILFDATFRNALTEGGIDGGGIDYQLCGPNCNTWTKYIGITYLGFAVFNYLPKNDQLFNYTGKNQTFADCADEKDARNCAILENISQKFFNKYSDDFNFDNLKIELYNVTSATDQTTITGFSARISDGIHNFLFDSDNAVGNYIEDVGDNNSYIVAGRGDNDTIIAGNGNDIVDAGSGTGEKNGIKKFANLGGGNDLYVGSAADDNVVSLAGDNTVLLGAGSDTYTGGDGNDLVYAGSIDYSAARSAAAKAGFLTTSNITSASMSDMRADKNVINLGGGENKYYGGNGQDIVTAEGNNKIYLGMGSDEFHGGDGNDYVDGGRGHDLETDENLICLGNGKNEYYGGKGKDTVYGGNGQDIIYGDEGDDYIKAGTGKDQISPGSGNDIVYLGIDDDKDILMVGSKDSVVTVYEYSGSDTVNCTGGIVDSQISGSDLILYGYNGNKVILKGAAVTENGRSAANNIPTIWQPDGQVLKWNGEKFVDSGIRYPAYAGLSTAELTAIAGQIGQADQYSYCLDTVNDPFFAEKETAFSRNTPVCRQTAETELLIQAMNAFAPVPSASTELSARLSTTEISDLFCGPDKTYYKKAE